MVSPIPSYDINFFHSAYKNICLIANKTWEINHDDSYRKFNQYLWVQNINWIDKYHENTPKRRVRDTIPESLLAQYGNYEYNEDREIQYKFNEEVSILESTNSDSNKTEPWMFDDVEDHCSPLTSQIPLIKKLKHTSVVRNDKYIAHTDEYYNECCPVLYTIDNFSELQLQMRISNDIVRRLWNSSEIPPNSSTNEIRGHFQSNYQLQNEFDDKRRSGRYKHQEISCNLQYPATKTKINAKEYEKVKSLPSLNAEVPEFFPKGSRDIHYEAVPLQCFSSNGKNYIKLYQDEPTLSKFNAFFQNPTIPLVTPPIMTPLIRPPHQWVPRIAPPLDIQIPVCSLAPQTFTSIQSICPMINRSPPIHHGKTTQPNPSLTSIPIPVYQRPPELYSDHKRKFQGVNFNNLILLTKNGMKVRRNQSKNSQQSSSFILESCQPNLKSEDGILQWLNEEYPKRVKEFIGINSLVNDFDEFDLKIDKINKNVHESNLSEQNNQDYDNDHNDDSSVGTNKIIYY